ncbi:MAG: rRNA pseudouridine synthase, partial [Fimbriimonas ginsengisoli]|nr:rRNA pseudouridine synthase [Fimbriimonas ginsengisoli]
MAAEGSVSSSERREWLAARIARSGYCSRRAATPLIRSGRVRVNGQAVTDPSTQVGHGDEVRVGRRVLAAARKVTLLLNKPVGFVTTLSDPQGRPTVANLLPDVGVALKPVGRLDLNTEGLLICTSDGELANRLMHPRYEVEKEYLLTVSGAPDERALRRLREGVVIEGVRTHPARVDVLRVGRDGAQLRFVLHE